ncbi:MAG TPA: hypothetical protein VM012_11680 [Flavitalea sp.]|nr:hypothetical protein [Flavitalea sp.]
MNRFFRFILFISFLITCLPSFAQTDKKDSSYSLLALESAIAQYREFEGPQSRLYNGTIYRDNSSTLSQGHPYFESNELSPAAIHYDGMVYNVPMLYNLVTEEVIIPHYNKVFKMVLLNDKIKEFYLLDHHFVRVVEKSPGDLLRTGFYEQLFKGRLTIFKKTDKMINEIIVNDKLTRFIQSSTSYYLQKDNVWHNVSGLRSVWALVGDQKSEIKRDLKKNKIKFRKHPDEALVKIAAYYETLSK